jgi:hypothetical protein
MEAAIHHPTLREREQLKRPVDAAHLGERGGLDGVLRPAADQREQ